MNKKYNVIRHPKTTQEAREAELIDLDEYEVKYRKKRNQKTLPNDYDDIDKSDYNDKSWKDLNKREKRYELS